MPFTDHETALLAVLETVAENCILAPTRNSEVTGVMVTLGEGFSGALLPGWKTPPQPVKLMKARIMQTNGYAGKLISVLDMTCEISFPAGGNAVGEGRLDNCPEKEQVSVVPY